MAAPVGHTICALALLKSGVVDIVDHQAFLAGTNFPDIRYIADIGRTTTHKMEGEGLEFVLSAPSSFEAGRRFHVFVDHEREKHMLKHQAYRFIKNGPLKTQMLKIVEDRILFDKLKRTPFKEKEVFGKIYDEERNFALKEEEITTWHNLLATYLDQTTWFNVVRYFRTLYAFQNAYGMPTDIFKNFWQNIKTFGFFIYAYFQIEKLSRDTDLRAIILDFYENRIEQIIKNHAEAMDAKTVSRPVRAPPPVTSFYRTKHERRNLSTTPLLLENFVAFPEAVVKS